jgi:prefoldin subunit 5
MNLDQLKSQRDGYAKQLAALEQDMAAIVKKHGELGTAREQLRGAVAALDAALSAANAALAQEQEQAPKIAVLPQDPHAVESNG